MKTAVFNQNPHFCLSFQGDDMKTVEFFLENCSFSIWKPQFLVENRISVWAFNETTPKDHFPKKVTPIFKEVFKSNIIIY